MKQVSSDGLTWFEQEEKQVKVGFTKKLIEELQECWHILPASKKVLIKAGQPLVSIETNEGLSSVASPVTGVISLFEDKAMNSPDLIDESTVVCVVVPEDQIAAKPAIAALHPAAHRLMAQLYAERPQRVFEPAHPVNWGFVDVPGEER